MLYLAIILFVTLLEIINLLDRVSNYEIEEEPEHFHVMVSIIMCIM